MYLPSQRILPQKRILPQALDIDYVIIAASEINRSYRDFCEKNYPGRFKHFFGSMEEQVAGDGMCKTCQNSSVGHLMGCHPKQELPEGTDLDLMISGSPCTPFSTQRPDRFQEDSVMCHKACDLTMNKVVALYVQWEPVKAILEQVWGFCMPFVKGGTETPKSRLTGAFFVVSAARVRPASGYLRGRCTVVD